MSWFTESFTMTYGELIMSVLAGVGLAVIILFLLETWSASLRRRAFRQRMDQVGKGDFPGAPF